MIGYMTLGANDLAKAGVFYDELFGDMGGQRMTHSGRLCKK